MRKLLSLLAVFCAAACGAARAQARPSAALPPPCATVDLSVSIVPFFSPAEADGQRILMLQVYNSGGLCALDWTAVDFNYGAYPFRHGYKPNSIQFTVDDLPGATPDSVPGPVVLRHAELARLRITWNTLQTLGKHHAIPATCHNLDGMRFAFSDDGPPIEIVALHTRVCSTMTISHFTWGWARQSSVLRASWAPDASPTDEAVYKPATGSVFGDHFNGIALSLKANGVSFPLGADVTLEVHIKNFAAPREPVVGEHPYRWLSMREQNGHTVLYCMGMAPPEEAGVGQPIPRESGIRLDSIHLNELGLLPSLIGNVTYALTAEFWPVRVHDDGTPIDDALAYAPTAVVSFRRTLNFTAGN